MFGRKKRIVGWRYWILVCSAALCSNLDCLTNETEEVASLVNTCPACEGNSASGSEV